MKVTIKSSTISEQPMIVMEADNNASIYYTIDNTEPNQTSILYTEPINYPINKIIKAIAYSGSEYSDIEIYRCSIPVLKSALTGMYNLKLEKVVIEGDYDFLYSENINCNTNIYMSPKASISNAKSIDLDGNHYLYPMFVDMNKQLGNARLLHVSDGQLIFDSANHIHSVYRNQKKISLSFGYYGTFVNKPVLTNNDIGFQYFCTDKQTAESSSNGIILYHKGNNIWVDSLGRIVDDNYPTAIKGATAQRPTLTSNDSGFEYYDTTLKKKILWNGEEWTNIDGTDLDIPTDEWITIE